MPTRLEEVDTLLDEIDAEIMSKYPEEMHANLHYMIAKKVQLEIERSRLVK